MKIHELAVVDPGAKLGANVTIGPFAVIGADVTIGDGCEIGAHVVIEGWTEIGAECRFHTGAVIGSPPQDLKYRGEETHLVIGKQNVFREYVTANIGTVGGGGVTQIGDNCLMMAYAHVAHDCQIGNQYHTRTKVRQVILGCPPACNPAWSSELLTILRLIVLCTYI